MWTWKIDRKVVEKSCAMCRDDDDVATTAKKHIIARDSFFSHSSKTYPMEVYVQEKHPRITVTPRTPWKIMFYRRGENCRWIYKYGKITGSSSFLGRIFPKGWFCTCEKTIRRRMLFLRGITGIIYSSCEKFTKYISYDFLETRNLGIWITDREINGKFKILKKKKTWDLSNYFLN